MGRNETDRETGGKRDQRDTERERERDEFSALLHTCLFRLKNKIVFPTVMIYLICPKTVKNGGGCDGVVGIWPQHLML